MPGFLVSYVHFIDRMNYLIGRATMFVIFVMVGVLFYSAISKTLFTPALWTFEFAQFLMVGYFLVGGAYSMQLNGHVRMDLFYGLFRQRAQARMDTFTSFFMIAYLGLLLYGSIDSTIYAIEYQERSYSIWRPYMWPVKVIMTTGIFLMLLQAFAQLIKDWAVARGEPLK